MISDLASTVTTVELTQRQRDLLDFERAWRFRYGGTRDTAILELFGCTPTRFAQEINALIDLPAALVHDPVTVNRLRRLRDTRRRVRTAK
jgi:hypothetical protein